MAIERLKTAPKNSKLPTTYALLDNNRARLEKIVEILSLAGFAPCSRINPSATTADIFEIRYKVSKGRYEFWQAYGIVKQSVRIKSKRYKHHAANKRAYRARRAAAGLPRI